MKPAHRVLIVTLLFGVVAAPSPAWAQEGDAPSANQEASPSTAEATADQDAQEAEEPVATPAPGPLEEVATLRAALTEDFARFKTAQGDERRLTLERILRNGRLFGGTLLPMVEALGAALEAGEADEERLGKVRDHVEWTTELLAEQVQANDALIDQAIQERERVAVEDLLSFEQELGREVATTDGLIGAIARNIDRKRLLRMPVEADDAAVEARLTETTEEVGGRIQLALAQSEELAAQLEGSIEAQKPAIEARLIALAERLNHLTASLQTLTDMMEARGLDTSEQRQLLIRSTGTVTPAIFDRKVAAGLLDTGLRAAKAWLSTNSSFIVSRSVLFLVILLAFRIIAFFVGKVTGRLIAVSASRVPSLLRKTAAAIARNTVMLIGFLVALSHVGLEVGPMLASLGVAGFILGFALQDSLSNFAAGAMILFYSPFDVGDVVEAGGVMGKVRQLSLVSTTILTFDNQRLIVPNRKIWGDVIRNVTAEELRRIDFTFTVSTTEDVKRAMALLVEIVAAHELILKEPAATVRLNDMQDGQASIVARPWVKTGDYWGVRWDIMETVKQRFDAEGFTIAPPRREIVIRPEK